MRALCADTTEMAARATAVRKLENYEWQGAENRVVYEALREVRESGPLSLRDQLPAHATRLGFPDVDWRNYSDRDPADNEEIGTIVDRLLAGPAERS